MESNFSVFKNLILCYNLPNRINRMRFAAVYCAYLITAFVSIWIFISIISFLTTLAAKFQLQNYSYIILAAYGLFAIIASAFVIVNILISTFKRLHDLGYSAWWSLAFLIPFIGQLLALLLLFIPGTKGPNKFGPAPEKATKLEYGIVISLPALYAILYIVALVLTH